jgi:hypothetical protein
VDRETWSTVYNLTNTANRTPTNVTHLVVHHSDGQNNASDFAAVVRSYWDFHANGRNWGDIGYHWLVDPNGVVYQGRAFNVDGNKDVIGTHAGGFNTNSMGICVIGSYTNLFPSDELRWRPCTMCWPGRPTSAASIRLAPRSTPPAGTCSATSWATVM